MVSSGFRENGYATRVAEVGHVRASLDRNWLEVDAFWMDDGALCESQYVPTEMRPTPGDTIFVIQQVSGPGKRRGAWVCMTSERAPRVYTISNARPLAQRSAIDTIGAAVNVLIEIVAIGVLVMLGWQYYWWLAVLIGLGVGGYMGNGYLNAYFFRKERAAAWADERKLFGEARERMSAFRAEWAVTHGPAHDETAAPREETTARAPAWWTVLGVAQHCREDEARSAGRALLMQYHPDRHMDLPELLRAAAAQQTKTILTAIDDAKRHFATAQKAS